MVALFWRSWALWLLGYPEAALSDAEYSLKDAREIGQAGTLMFALANTSVTQIFCGNYATADTQSEELVALADKKATLLWHAIEKMNKGSILALTGKASAAVQTIIAGITEWRQTGELRCCRGIYQIWRWRMENSANSMTLGAASAKR